MSGSAKRLSLPPLSATGVASRAELAASLTAYDQPPAPVDEAAAGPPPQEQWPHVSAAVTRIWQRHRIYLYGLSLRWLRGDRAAAEDAVADVIYRALVTIASRQVIVNERAWLTRVLHNRCMDVHRSRNGIQPLDAGPGIGDEGLPGDARVDRSGEELMLNRELGEIINKALAELPEMLRGPVTMRLNDEPYTSISAAFRISEANARKRIQQARQILRQRLETYLHSGDR